MTDHESSLADSPGDRDATDDLPACRLSVADAIEQCPTDCAPHRRAQELLREAATLLEADR